MFSAQFIALGILIFCVVFFLTEWIPSTLTCMIACVLFVVTGICSFSQAFSGFSNSIVILVFGMLVIGDAMFESGVSQVIGSKVMQLASHSERRFILIAGLTAALMSMFLANTAVIAMFLAISNSVSQTNRDVRLKNICLATSMAAMFGGSCTLVGSTPQLTVQSILEGSGVQTLAMWDYLPVGSILTALYLVYVLCIGYPLGKRIWGDRADDAGQGALDSVSAEPGHVRSLDAGSKRKQITMVCILLLMIVLFITEWLSNVMTACVCAILCVLTGCTSEKSILKNMDWRVLIRLAGCLGIAVGIDQSGCGTLLANSFIAVFGSDVKPVVFLAAAVLLVMLISNFITNSTAVFVVLPPILAICMQLGFNPRAFALAICYGANLCFATPLANAQTGMTMVAGYQFKDYIKYNILLELIVLLGIVLFVPMFYPLYA